MIAWVPLGNSLSDNNLIGTNILCMYDYRDSLIMNNFVRVLYINLHGITKLVPGDNQQGLPLTFL